MKVVGAIKDIVLDREYTRQDGTTASIHNVVIVAGDDEFVAQTFISRDGMDKRGIRIGAIGNARIEFEARSWNDREGKNHKTQQVTLGDWRAASGTTTTTTSEPSQQEVVAGMAEVAAMAEAHINPETGMPF